KREAKPLDKRTAVPGHKNSYEYNYYGYYDGGDDYGDYDGGDDYGDYDSGDDYGDYYDEYDYGGYK
ncbi:2433_t:CDS:2, partial [Dentiscutata heterogama]